MVRLAVVSAGAPRHAKNLKIMLQETSDKEGWGWECDFLEWQKDGYESYDFTKYDWLWNEGNFENVFVWMSTLPESCGRIARWVGTDILQHDGMVRRGYPDPFGAAHIHIADAINLQEEARQLTGLDVGLVRSIPPEAYARAPIERWDGVLGYVPTGRDDFFRWPWFLELARDYPHLTFHVIGREQEANLPSNVRTYKEISGEDKRRLFESCFVYLRPIEHDGVGLTLIEMAQLGRWVFHTDTRIPHVLPARNLGEIEFGLDSILDSKRPPRQEISEYYVREFSRERLQSDLEGLRQAMGRHVPIS